MCTSDPCESSGFRACCSKIRSPASPSSSLPPASWTFSAVENPQYKYSRPTIHLYLYILSIWFVFSYSLYLFKVSVVHLLCHYSFHIFIFSRCSPFQPVSQAERLPLPFAQWSTSWRTASRSTAARPEQTASQFQIRNEKLKHVWRKKSKHQTCWASKVSRGTFRMLGPFISDAEWLWSRSFENSKKCSLPNVFRRIWGSCWWT